MHRSKVSAGELTAADMDCRVYHSVMERTGELTTSNPLLNRLHENAVWSMRSNFVSIPTDCPQRDERMGLDGRHLPVRAYRGLFV